jgi:transposase-like protein
VSRQFQEASAAALRSLCERRFEEVELLVIYIDGQDLGGHQVVSAVGVDTEGRKHVLGLAEGATENAVVVKGLLEDLMERGVKPGRRRLFVIDGSKALRWAGAAALETEKRFRKIVGHQDLWMLKAALDEPECVSPAAPVILDRELVAA